MAQPNKSTSGDPDKRYKRKWDSIFHDNDLYFDEELDYEYEYDEDITKSFPIRYTWSASSSVASSPSSSRPASPINLIDDDEEYAKTRAIKKLTREFNHLVAVKHEFSPPYLRQNWRKNADFKGILKRWRIRSLDVIFSFKRGCERSSTVRRPIQHVHSRDTETDPVSNIAIVVNNDLCTNVVPDPNYALPMPQHLDISSLNVPSSSHMFDQNEHAPFFEQNIFEPCNAPVCDTIFRNVQQPSQEPPDIRIVRPGSAISFKQILRHEPYKRPASVGGQSVVRADVFSNFVEANRGENRNFTPAWDMPNHHPLRHNQTPFPNQPDDEDLDPNVVHHSNVPYV